MRLLCPHRFRFFSPLIEDGLCGAAGLSISPGLVAPLTKKFSAFTLVELLVVMAIISVLLAFSALAFTSLGGADTLDMNVSSLSDLLQQARVYASSNHTYVYLGLQEASSSTVSSGIGHVSAMTVASVTGTCPYTATPVVLTALQVAPVGKLEYFDNFHITSSASLLNGNMANRPGSSSGPAASPVPGFIDLSADTSNSMVSFQWPLSGTAQHTFIKVIEFDPQGAARVQNTTGGFSPTLPSYIEIGLLPSHGTSVNSVITNDAAIQVDGMTGVVRVYRP